MSYLFGLVVVVMSMVFARPIGAAEAPVQKLRVIAETDAGGDPDDEGSLVRFLLYSNEWDIEGIIADRPKTDNQGCKSGLELVRKILGAYGDCHANLIKHKPDYPTHETLYGRTVAGYDDADDGVKLIIAALEKDDPRPIWFANWGSNSGTTSSMKRALDRLKKQKSAEGFARIVGKIRCTRNAEKFLPHAQDIPLFVDTRNPDKWYHRFRPLTEKAGGFDVRRDVQNVGPLGKVYSTPKEGDSMAVIYLIPTGLSDPNQPTWGSWGGRYSPLTKQIGSSGGSMGVKPREGFYWAEAEDTLGEVTGRDNTLSRWAAALQNDFAARMQWSVKGEFGQANHEPVVHCQGDGSRKVLAIRSPAGGAVRLSAEGSSDPDGDKLSYRWYVYPEAGTYRGKIEIRDAQEVQASLDLPADAAGKTVHVILEVTDSGKPALTRYRRVVIEGQERQGG